MLDTYVSSYAGEIDNDFMLQYDNARSNGEDFERLCSSLNNSLLQLQARKLQLASLLVLHALRRCIVALNPPAQTFITLRTGLHEKMPILVSERIDRITDCMTHR